MDIWLYSCPVLIVRIDLNGVMTDRLQVRNVPKAISLIGNFHDREEPRELDKKRRKKLFEIKAKKRRFS